MGRVRAGVLLTVSVVALLLTGCGDVDGSASTTAGTDAPSPAVVEAEHLLDEIEHGVRPTQAQTDAVRYLEHVTFQTMIVGCMAKEGFVYLAPAAFRVPSPVTRAGDGALDPVDPAALEADGLGLNATVAGLLANAEAGEPIVLDTGDPDDPRIPEHEVPGWSEAESGCVPSTAALDARVAHPAYEREEPFRHVVDRVLGSEPVSGAMAAYPECMGAKGWAVKDRHDLVWSVRGRFEDLLVDEEAAFAADPDVRAAQVDELVGSDEWDRLLEARADAASADAACRRDAHDLAFAALLAPLRRFKADHATEIEQLGAEWAAFEERANQTPDPAQH